MSCFQPDDSERHGNHEAGVIYPFQPPSFGSHPQTLNREVEQARNTLQAVTQQQPLNSESVDNTNNLDSLIRTFSNDVESCRVRQNVTVVHPIKRDLMTHGIFASLRRSSHNDSQPAPADQESPLYDINPWPGPHTGDPNPNPHADSFYSEPLPPLRFDQANLPANSVPAVNWVEGLFDHLPSEPQASYQEAGPSRSVPNPNIPQRLTFDDEIAHTRLLITRASSRLVQRNKPYEKTRPSMGPPRRNPNHWESDVLEVMKYSIFNGVFLPKPHELVEMARQSLDSSSDNGVQWAMTEEGHAGVMKISEVLGNIRDSIKELTRAWVIPGYQIPLYTQTAPMIQLFVEELVKEYKYLKGAINVSAGNLPFGHQAIISFIKHLLFHDRQYWRYISPTKNLGPLLAYTSTLHTWALDEISTGRFFPIEFNVIAKQSTYNAFVQLFETLTDEERHALNTYIMAQA
ncbi:uncharacterized protein HD556DRAFT_1450373 [Suillus plorans]|uniref:DUF6532 domain-containing protein n=1 Tax=Suillus plorans TaxID=116603 RepID=A0A9P7AB34_9AGAM|nr:uncharacterized protein HD556DRAFT_1450373 [Suillus plorans]KAG1785824.1 hypothetical protein HD556DRAFT_1450373 [Suillus plorans]